MRIKGKFIMIRIIFGEAEIGGSESLILRLSRGFVKCGYIVIFYCSKILDSVKHEFVQEGIQIVEYGKRFEPCILKNITNDDIIITLGSFDYLNVNMYLFKKRFKCKVFLYVVHPYTLPFFLTNPIVKKLLQRQYESLINNGIKNNSIYFMDEQTLRYTNDHMKINISDISSNHIIRIPIDNMQKLDIEKIKRKTVDRKNNFVVLTVARSDFPFKGYIKGLILLYAELKSRYPQFKLVIVTSGDKIEEVEAWISQIQKEKQKDILLKKNMPYNKLKKFYETASLYVGMGTTILEAACKGVISIPVAPYTYECNAEGFFHDRPEWLLTEIEQGYNIGQLIETVINMDNNDYLMRCEKTQNLFGTMYSLDTIVNKFLNADSTNKLINVKGLLKFYIFIKRKRKRKI